jgi:hypothetical protein
VLDLLQVEPVQAGVDRHPPFRLQFARDHHRPQRRSSERIKCQLEHLAHQQRAKQRRVLKETRHAAPRTRLRRQ